MNEWEAIRDAWQFIACVAFSPCVLCIVEEEYCLSLVESTSHLVYQVTSLWSIMGYFTSISVAVQERWKKKKKKVNYTPNAHPFLFIVLH